MCGIFGVYNQENKIPLNREQFYQPLTKIRHRGPDASGIYLPNNSIGLAHARLSIIDLSEAANQPFLYEGYAISYNGEIYNYVEIRSELEDLGYTFSTQSDTEVVIIAYSHWGETCIDRFNGMWAFVIYDSDKDCLFCSRDRFGIKPFNYGFSNGRFLFSSEIKAILAFDPSLKIPHYPTIANYCRESIGAQSTQTWFENIYRLPPAHNLFVYRNRHELKQYWDYPKDINQDISFEEALQNYQTLFKDAIRLRMRSDVPVGATLSSGLDSSSIVSYLDKSYQERLNCYTASFPNQPYDEYPLTARFVKSLSSSDLKRVVPKYEDYVSELAQVIYHLESGHSSPAIFPLSAINNRARQDVKVFMEGQGADEMLGGYLDKIILNFCWDLIKRGKFKTAIRELKVYLNSNSFLLTLIFYLRNYGNIRLRRLMRQVKGVEGIYAEKLKFSTLGDPPKYGVIQGNSALNKALLNQHKTGLVNLLHYGDAISMRFSLENRLPFMDYRLVELVFSLPFTYKIKNGLGKYLHRQAVKDILPDFILNNRNKLGFPSPTKELFEPNKPATNILLSKQLSQRELFKPQKILDLLQKQQSGKEDNSRLLFRVLSVELWFRIFIDESFDFEKTD